MLKFTHKNCLTPLLQCLWLPNVAFCTYKKTVAGFQPSRPRNGALATAKQQGPEGRSRPAGNDSDCLTFLFGGSKLQASCLQKGPLATAKQHLIACRNRAQTYPHKLPNAPSEFLEKISLFLSPAALVWWLQAASIRLAEGIPRHSKTAPNCVPKPCSNLPT